MKKNQDQRKKSNCRQCPLDGQNKVWGVHLGEDPRLVFIGEAPGKEEAQQGEPFVGPAGMQLKTALGYTRISFAFAHRMNVINCRPPNNKISSSEGELAQDCCYKGFKEELEGVLQKGGKVVVPLGNTAMKALGVEGTITKNRGSVFMSPLIESFHLTRVVPVVPTFHPSYILRGQFKEIPTWIADLKKAYELTKKEYKPPKEKFTTFPTLNDVIKFKNKVVDGEKLVGVDIETIGLNPFHASGQIVMIGLSYDKSHALVVPFLDQNKNNYWNMEEERIVKTALRTILKECETLFQNCLFDAFWLAKHIGPCEKIKHDVLIAHHSLNPELKHDLGYITSIYGDTPFWKELNLKGEKAIFALSNEEFRTYNARDSVVLHQVLPGLLKDLRDDSLMDTYERGMQLVYPILEMQLRGIPIDEKALKNYRSSLKRQITKSRKKIYEVGELPDAFNINSGDDMRYLFFGEIPKKSKVAQEKLKEYNSPKCKKRKDSKKYRKLESDANIVEQTRPFKNYLHYVKYTDAGNIKVDNEVLQDIYKALFKRKETIDGLKRRREEHDNELLEIDKEVEVLKNLFIYNKAEKEHSTYTSFYVPDGSVHPKYLIHGTNTGRLCVDPDIEVETPRDFTKPRKKLKELKKGDWVFSFNEDRELCLKKVRWVGPTKVKPTLIVHTDRGKPFTLSRDHLVRKWRGEWVHAKDLKVGDRLLCMPPIGNNGEDYLTFFPHSRNRANGKKGGGQVRVHRFVFEKTQHELRGNSLIHHIDRNKMNNTPENLQWMKGVAEHMIHHSYKNNIDLLKKAVATGIGKTGKPLSKETLRKYKARYKKLKRNHRVIKIEEGSTKQLWDLEVEDTHCFIGNDVALHNSSRDPNGQNIPKSAKKAFVVPKGRVFIQADYSNLELRVLAYISKDKSLLEIFKKGLNVHTENCKMMFGLTENDPMWKDARHACKTYQFGRNYGGTLKGIYRRVVNQVPELNLSYSRFESIDKQYKREHPEQEKWSKEVQKIGKRERISTNAFGRKRYLLGSFQEIEREALNSPIQSTAADIMNLAVINIYKDKRKEQLDVWLHGTVHDSLLVSCPVKNKKKGMNFLKEKMEIKVKINKFDCEFPVDFEVGESWGELTEV